MNEQEREQRAEKAKRLRYKKAVAVEMNLSSITQWMWDTMDALSEVTYLAGNDDMLVDAFGGDEEQAFEFRVAFEALGADMDRFYKDMEEQYIPECFDDFFCAVSRESDSFMGWDAVEQDYFGLSGYDGSAGQEEARKRLERMTKAQMLEAAQDCFAIAVAYLGLRSRHDDLRAALDILRAENTGLLDAIKAIEEIYEKWSGTDIYEEQWRLEKQMENIADRLPEEVWLR